MTEPLSLHVLGAFQVVRDGSPVDLPPSRKTRALLAYLALNPRPQRRERLCEVFWEIPDDPRGALRWSLSKIRQILGEAHAARLQADRHTVALDTRGLDIDAAAVSHVLAADLDRHTVDALETLADRFRGAFLEDLELARCPAFEAWRTGQTRELELARIALLRHLVARLKHDPQRALRHARVLRSLVGEAADVDAQLDALDQAAREVVLGTSPPPAEPPPVETAPARAGGQQLRFCTTVDGTSIAYATLGSGPPLLRAAHWMSHLEYDLESPVWRHWIEGLSAGNTLIRYDERLNGLSDQSADNVSFEAMLADLEAVVEASGQRRFVLLGVSQSCAVSVAYAVRHPERVAGMILYGGYARGWRKRADAMEIAQREAMATLMRVGWGQNNPVFRQLFTSLFLPEASAEQIGWFNDLQRRTVTPENACRLQEVFGHIDVSDLLPQVRVPTLVIHARGDLVAPFEAGRGLAAAIPGARFVALDSNNHILLAQEPAFGRFLDEVRGFTAEVLGTPASVSMPRAVRRPVTALHVDLVSPLQSLEFYDPEAAVGLLDPVRQQVRQSIEAHGGCVLANRDGTVSAVFGARLASENHALPACRAALAIRDSVGTQRSAPVRARIALDSGEALVRLGADGDTVADVAGGPVRGAQRLAESLRRDRVAATPAYCAAAGGHVAVVPLGRDEYTTAVRHTKVFEVTGENTAISRWHLRIDQGLTRLIGRQDELACLAQALTAARGGAGRVVCVVADPGYGKSRLTHEFLGSEACAGCTLVEAGALEFDAHASLALVKRLLQSLLTLGEVESAGGRVQRRLTELGMAETHMAPVFAVLGLPIDDADWSIASPMDRSRRVRNAVAVLVAAAAAVRPLVLLIEDLHWMDRASEAVIEHLAGQVAGLPVLLLATTRPAYRAAWCMPPRCTRLDLPALGSTDSDAFVHSVLGDDAALAELKQHLVVRMAGVPLYIEETVRALAQDGYLRGAPGAYTLGRAAGEIGIAGSVQAVIAARIDRLPDTERLVVETAAVIGAHVPERLLATLCGLGAEALERVLHSLQEAQLLLEHQRYPERVLAFKHALIHEAVYAAMPREQRREVHAQVLSALTFGAEGSTVAVERLAEHAWRGGLWESAAGFMVQAADKAADASSFAEAARFLEQAVEANQRLPETPHTLARGIDIRSRMRAAYEATQVSERILPRLLEAQTLAERLGDVGRQCQVRLNLSYLHSIHGRLDEAVYEADQLKALASGAGEGWYAKEADLAAAQALLQKAWAGPALERLRPHQAWYLGAARYERLGLLCTRAVFYFGHVAQAHSLLGDMAAAKTALDRARQVAAEVRRSVDRHAAAYFESLVRLVGGAGDEDIRRLEAMVAECGDGPPSPFLPWVQATLGHTYLLAGRLAEAGPLLALAESAARAADMPQFVNYAQTLAACAGALADGRPDVAVMAQARAFGDPWLGGLVLRTMAGVSPADTAMGLFDEAIGLAQANGFAPDAAEAVFARGCYRLAIDTEAAAGDLEAALGQFRALGLDRRAEAVEAVLAVM